MQEISKENNYSEINEGLCVLDFWAEWCGQCKVAKAKLSEIESNYPNVKFIACDSEANDDLCAKFMVRGLPTIVFLKDGEVVVRQVGASGIEENMEKLLNA